MENDRFEFREAAQTTAFRRMRQTDPSLFATGYLIKI